MKYALHGSAQLGDANGSVKRPRSPTRIPALASNFIDLTGDDDSEAPPAKRQRSHTPVINKNQSAKPSTTITSSGVRPVPPDSANQNGKSTAPKKKSPFSNVSTWRAVHKDGFIAYPKPPQPQPVNTGRNGHISGSKPKQDAPKSDLGQSTNETRFSLSCKPPAKQSLKEDLKDYDDDSILEAFRMPISKPLKFDAVNAQAAATTNGTIMEIDDNSDFSIEKDEKFKISSPPALKFDPTSHVSSMKSSVAQQNSATVKRPASKSGSVVRDQPKKPKPRVNIPPVSTMHTNQNVINNPISLPVRASPVPPRTQNTIPPSSSQTSISRPFIINVSPSKSRKERMLMVETLKKNANFAKTQPAEVERVLGLTGFASSYYPTTIDVTKLMKAALPKKRKVDRSTVKLDLLKTKKHNDDIVSSLDKLTFVHPIEQARAVLTDRFGENFDPPLTFSNDVNNARLDGKFQFISSNIFRKGVKAGNSIGQPGCSCTGPCQIDCSCLRKVFDDHISKGVEQVQSYRRRSDNITVLTSNYMNNYAKRAEISECNERCGCPPSCTNRVVQNGRTIPLEIFQTSRCGFGVRSSQPIVRGQFIELYLGEIITETDLCRREAAQEEGASSYVYSLDWFPFPSHNTLHIDGHNFGSAMRFVNHSCNPNARTFTSLGHGSTRQIYDVGFFAVEDIPALTEITIDYSPQMEGEIHEIDEDDEDVVQCLCGSVNCRRKLWRVGKERKGRKKLLDKGDD